mmetsp:Transcript_46961/g.134014  ORF Transcript_46961/g.134014 Transcript_46961/m.134014 type:complete len:212 (-) Transcript_46961:261-896(-)
MLHVPWRERKDHRQLLPPACLVHVWGVQHTLRWVSMNPGCSRILLKGEFDFDPHMVSEIQDIPHLITEGRKQSVPSTRELFALAHHPVAPLPCAEEGHRAVEPRVLEEAACAARAAAPQLSVDARIGCTVLLGTAGHLADELRRRAPVAGPVCTAVSQAALAIEQEAVLQCREQRPDMHPLFRCLHFWVVHVLVDEVTTEGCMESVAQLFR